MSILAHYLTEPELAAQLKKSRRALQVWRHQHKGPPWTQVGSTVFYAEDSVRAWLKALEQQPSDAA
ncbi:helix-turn-helix domain-containing protein [Bradyrhizobium sp. CB82]|uniref:helix-turn-helix domain-containing protein n=1 Tax=Bradyrhizobium sp. CB82 TaxID=3039159 RepID=UPI0024B03E1E|nr:helix-turn-helix domain-containing protein [Bradyrhizobium sp. CB82]WFU37596.1 helix-turn-helix domain-containing protein [Bradyrhizobium sp. CB82]